MRYHATSEGNIPFTTEEELEWDIKEANFQALKDSKLIENERFKRNQLLNNSDWTQVADAPVDKAVWATYRQALRDLTAQAGFPQNITWPDEPQ
jgi:hypothetical protein